MREKPLEREPPPPKLGRLHPIPALTANPKPRQHGSAPPPVRVCVGEKSLSRSLSLPVPSISGPFPTPSPLSWADFSAQKNGL